jgi:general secretion pathway protein B
VSYILEALRKSDQLRRRGGAPALLLGPPAAAAHRRPALLWYGLPALVLLGAGIAIGWLRPWESEPEATAPVAAAQPSVPQPKPAPRAQALPAPAQRMPESLPVPKARRAPVPARAAAEPKKRSARPASAAPKRAPALTPAPSPARAPAQPATVVMNLSELPIAIQQELPAMSITVHAYSSRPAERLVGINDRLLHEGDDVAPGLKLEQITPEGMILSYKGYNFRRGVH